MNFQNNWETETLADISREVENTRRSFIRFKSYAIKLQKELGGIIRPIICSVICLDVH